MKPEVRGEVNQERVVAGAMCESTAMEVVCVKKTAVAIGSEGSRRTQSAMRKGTWQLKCRSGRTRDAPRSRAKVDASRRQGLENSGIVR